MKYPVFKHPIKSFFKSLISSSAKNLSKTPWYEIDLFRSILRFKNPKQTFFPSDQLITDLFYQDARPFIDTINKPNFRGLIANGRSSCDVTKTGWEFNPTAQLDSDRVVLTMDVEVMCAYPREGEVERDLNDIQALKSWVDYCHKQCRVHAEQYDFVKSDDGMLSVEFLNALEDEETQAPALPHQSSRSKAKSNKEIAPSQTHESNRAKTQTINGRNWVKIKEPGELHYYTAIAKKDALCFSFERLASDGDTQLCTSPSAELEQKIQAFIVTLLETVTITPSKRLQTFLKNKGVEFD